MHIRINIPKWSKNEYLQGLGALLAPDPGKYLKKLQNEIESIVSDRYVYLLSSARYGLTLAVKHLKLKDKHIAVPGYCCPAIITGLRAGGAVPVAIDVLDKGLNFDPDKLDLAIKSGQVNAVLHSNTYGLDLDNKLSESCNVPVIEDAAYQSGKYDQDGNLYGLREDVGVWSFNFKSLTSIGGGVLFTQKKMSLPIGVNSRSGGLKHIFKFANYLTRSLFHCHIPGFLPGAKEPKISNNSVRKVLLELSQQPMSALQASIALSQWRNRESIFLRQQKNFSLIKETVNKCSSLVSVSGHEGIYLPHLFPLLLCVRKDDVRRASLRFRQILYDLSIQTEEPYPILLGTHETLPKSYEIASRMLLIPCNASIGDKGISKICEAIIKASMTIEQEFD